MVRVGVGVRIADPDPENETKKEYKKQGKVKSPMNTHSITSHVRFGCEMNPSQQHNNTNTAKEKARDESTVHRTQHHIEVCEH